MLKKYSMWTPEETAARALWMQSHRATTSKGRIISVIFVLQQVTVPNVASRETLKASDDPRHHPSIGCHSIYPP